MGTLKFFLTLSLVISHWSFAEVRYVSHSGTDTPPYLTWETAADSIMSAINISSFGDTIYVANGVYKEQVVMIPGLSLIGAGMDSCVIDTRALVNSNGFISVDVADDCIFRGFNIKTYYNTTKGYGIAVRGNDLITQNKISNSWHGMYCGYTGIKIPNISNNILNNVSMGFEVFNSSSVIHNNLINTDPNSQSAIRAGIYVEAFDLSYHPIIDYNYIEVSIGGTGIRKDYGARPIISNNTIRLVQENTKGISIGYSDSTKVFNNLIIGDGNGGGITDGFEQQIYNNVVSNVKYAAFEISGIVKNNIAINSGTGFVKYGSPIIQFNECWNNNVNYSGFTPNSTNLSVNPMVVNTDTSQGDLDFHLQMFSPLIDRGDPDILDKDGTRSDIGLYGGPYGETYKYVDLPPRIPVNLSATIDSIYILLKWNKNTEEDFSHYNLFRDTTENFTVDSTTFVVSTTDTTYLHIFPPRISNLYFKLTAADNQGNQSEPSEELHVLLTGINDKKQITISNYRLYQNYPNPFNPSTKIGYLLKERGYVKLYVYDIKGELVETLVNKYQEGGYYEISFNVGQDSGPDIASGVYIYQIMVRNENNIPVFSDIKKMVYIK